MTGDTRDPGRVRFCAGAPPAEGDAEAVQRAARAESWLFDIVSGLARNADDWEPVAKYGALLEERAREITKTVLSPDFMERVSRSRW